MRVANIVRALLVPALAVFTPAAGEGLLVELNPDLLMGNSDNTAATATHRRTLVADSTNLVQLAEQSNKHAVPWMFLADDKKPEADVHRCANSPSVEDRGKVEEVLIALSDCVTTPEFKAGVDAWIKDLESQNYKYFDGSTASDIKYEIRAVEDGCPSNTAHFKPLSKGDATEYLALISVARTPAMAKEVEDFATTKKITKRIGINIDSSNEIEGYIAGKVTSEAFLTDIDLFTLARAVQCKSLKGGVATSYVDKKGKRKCFCSCPLGFKEEEGKCEKIESDESCDCAWEGNSYPVQSSDSESGKCSIKNLASSHGLPVPVPHDNYVDHSNDNGDVTETSPHISIHVVKESDGGGVAVSPTPVAWKDFQKNSKAEIDKVELTAFGKYSVELQASDYNSSASCKGCVVVLDDQRPTPTTKCPQAGEKTVTWSNRESAQKDLDAVKCFKTKATNDACSVDNRCDEDASMITGFGGGEGIPSKDLSAVDALDDEPVKNDLLEYLLGTAPASKCCERCVQVSTALKEHVTPYSCSPYGTTEPTCEGTHVCGIKRCISVDGEVLAKTSAKVNDETKANSRKVLNAKLDKSKKKTEGKLKELDEEYKLDRDIHVALDCSKYEGKTKNSLLAGETRKADAEVCTFKSKVSSLIALSVMNNKMVFTEAELNAIVDWSYSIEGVETLLNGSEKEETFKDSETTIEIKAMTKCGKVESFTFNVVLHLNNEINVCKYFPDMWSQTLVAPKISSHKYCMYPDSDFAEVTFDYHPNIGLDYDPTRFKMSIDSVKCYLQYGGAGSEVLALDVTGAPYEVVKQFAIDGVDQSTTKVETSVKTWCDFTYKRSLNDMKVVHTCTHSLTIVDCSPPVIDKPCELEGECDLNKCAKAGTGGRDIYQACGGYRVSQAPGLITTITEGEEPCCDSCTSDKFNAPVCQRINENPSDSSFEYIKRCVPVKKAHYPEAPVYQGLAAAQLEKSPNTNTMTAATTLLGASALIAVVALVVVRRRGAAKNAMEEDAYYAMLG